MSRGQTQPCISFHPSSLWRLQTWGQNVPREPRWQRHSHAADAGYNQRRESDVAARQDAAAAAVSCLATGLRHQDPSDWIHTFSHSVFEIGEVPLIQKVYSLPRRSRPRGGRSAPVSRSRDSFRKSRKVAFAVHARSRPPSQTTQLHHFSLAMSRSLGRSFRTGGRKSS